MIAGFRASNHPQQIGLRGVLDDIDDRRTEPAFVRSIEDEIGAPFTLDVAANAENTKAPSHFSILEDGLEQPWTGRVWCNPPYSDCRSWVAKAWSEWEKLEQPLETIVMLLPANRSEQAWWQDLVEPRRDRPGSPLRTRFLRGRMRFERPAAVIGPKGDRPPFGCVLLIWSKP